MIKGALLGGGHMQPDLTAKLEEIGRLAIDLATTPEGHLSLVGLLDHIVCQYPGDVSRLPLLSNEARCEEAARWAVCRSPVDRMVVFAAVLNAAQPKERSYMLASAKREFRA